MFQRKATTAKGKRVLQSREAKTEETAKVALFLKSTTTSENVSLALKDLHSLKKPNAVMFSKKNNIKPFEDHKPLEFFSQKNQASLLVLASHSKKRPNSLIFTRTFNYEVIDKIEFHVEECIPMDVFETSKPAMGNRPLIVFQGPQFETGEYSKIRDFFLDFFRGEQTEEINLKGLNHVISITADTDNLIHFRTYMTDLKKSSDPKLPRVELEEFGPALKLRLGRKLFCPDDIFKVATKVPKVLLQNKVKNIERDEIGDKTGRIHMKKQDLNSMQTRKFQGLKREKKEVSEGAESMVESTPSPKKKQKN